MSSIPAFQLVANLTRRVDIVDGDTYVSFNAVHPPRPPRLGLFRFAYPERCYSQAQWFTDKYPFMAFCVKCPEWTGLFSCLAGTRSSFPVVQDHMNKYMLHPSLQRKWWQLEQSLIGSCEIILGLISGSGHALDMEIYSLPQSWGFMRKHDSEDDARIRILNSRNAFIPLMALFAYTAAIHMCHKPNLDDSTPSYIRNLTEGSRVDEQWLSELVMHPYSRPAIPRVGVYINWDSFVPTNLLQYMVRYRVPVWVRLPGSIPHRLPNMIPPLVVPREQFEAARTKSIAMRNPGSSTITPSPALRREKTNSNVPRNRHVPGDTINGHIGRYWEERMRTIEAETPDATANRLLRELEAVQYNCPGKKGAYVYEWQASATGYTRVYVPRDQVPDVWASYANSQKFYDSIHHEWDLCTELDPDATIDEDYDDDPTFVPYAADALQRASDVAQLTRTFIEEKYSNTAPVVHNIHIASIDEVLFMVYGFHPDGRPYKTPSDLIPLDRIPRILIETTFNPEGHDVNQICHFVSSFVKGPEYVPAPLHDLHADNGLRLAFRNPPTFNLDKNDLDLYVLTQPARTPMRVYVPCASLVVQTLRVPGCDELTDIATLFCAKGSPFYYGDTLVANPFKAPSICVSGLGFRRRGFRPTWVDYQAYVARRSQLLSNPSIARAALMQGGIVWRLTVDTLQEMHGSVDFESYFTQDIEPAHLTLHDLGVIVGLYRLWSGDVGADKALSWWPQRHTWNAGGYFIGQWTSACESWYTNRINGIRSSSFDAKGASDWEKSLNLFKQTRQLRRNHEIACESFLQSSLIS